MKIFIDLFTCYVLSCTIYNDFFAYENFLLLMDLIINPLDYCQSFLLILSLIAFD